MVENRKITINLQHRRIFLDNTELTLTHTENSLFTYMCINKSGWHKRESIITKIWPDVHRINRVVDTAVCKINNKGYKIIGNRNQNEKLIISAPNYGYKFNEDYEVVILGKSGVIGNQDETTKLIGRYKNVNDKHQQVSGKYRHVNNKKKEVDVLGVASYNQMNYVVFKVGDKFFIEPNPTFFATYRKVP